MRLRRSGSIFRRTALVFLLGFGLLPAPAPLAAQQGCEFIAPSGEFNRRTIGASVTVTVKTPHLVCAGGTRIEADSARAYPVSDYYQLFGNVRFEDSVQVGRAEEVQYFQDRGLLLGHRNVHLTDKRDGRVLTGEDLRYLQAGALRSESELIMRGGRPHAVIYLRPGPAAQGIPSDTVTARPDTVGVTGAAPDTAAADEAPPEVAPDTAVVGRPTPDSVDLVPLRPREVQPEDTAGVPYEIDADRIELRGQDRFEATGRVEIVRDSLQAFADTAEYDEAVGTLLLRGHARVDGESYDLEGREIDLGLPGSGLREVTARHEARVQGDEIRIAAPRIRIFLADGALERLVAVTGADTTLVDPAAAEGAAGAPVAGSPQERRGAGEVGEPADEGEEVERPSVFEMEHPPRPVARGERFDMVADSIEVQAPDERIERVVAVGQARGESGARDSLNTGETPPEARRDWIDGDTLIAEFGPVELPDTAAGAAPGSTVTEYRMERLVARSNARSLYRMAARDTTLRARPAAAPGDTLAADTLAVPPARLAIHYVKGQEITLILEGGRVKRSEVVGQVQGVHFEPVGPGERRRSGGGDQPPRPERSGNELDDGGGAR